IRAYNQLNAGVSPIKIAQELQSSIVDSIFKYGDEIEKTEYELKEVLADDELYNRVIQELLLNEEVTVKKKVYLQEMLINLNSLNYFYTRTRKSQVLTEGNIVQRNANVTEITMNDDEAD